MSSQLSPLQKFLARKLLDKTSKPLKILHQINQIDDESFFKQLLPTSINYVIETNADDFQKIKLKVLHSYNVLCEKYCFLALHQSEKLKTEIQSMDDDQCREIVFSYLSNTMIDTAIDLFKQSPHHMVDEFVEIFQKLSTKYKTHFFTTDSDLFLFPIAENVMNHVFQTELQKYTIDYGGLTDIFNNYDEHIKKYHNSKDQTALYSIFQLLKKNNIVITENDVQKLIEIEHVYVDDICSNHQFEEVMKAIFLPTWANMLGLHWSEVPYRMDATHLRINNNFDVLSHHTICMKQYWIMLFLNNVALGLNQIKQPTEHHEQLKQLLCKSYLVYTSADEHKGTPTFESRIKLFSIGRNGQLYFNLDGFGRGAKPYIGFFLKDCDPESSQILRSIKGDVIIDY